jgi:hypothetical protein
MTFSSLFDWRTICKLPSHEGAQNYHLHDYDEEKKDIRSNAKDQCRNRSKAGQSEALPGVGH